MSSQRRLAYYKISLVLCVFIIAFLLYTLNSYQNIRLEFRPTTATSEPETSILTLDNFVKDCINNRIIGQIANETTKVSNNAVVNGMKEDSIHRSSSFVNIFNKQSWGADGTGFAHSGVGSTLTWTNEIISHLNVIANAIKAEKGDDYVVKILDVPCGDLQWMPRFLDMRKTDVNYTGMDIVPAVITHHKEKFKDQKWNFILQDIVEVDKLPAYDLIVSRMFMQHLLHADVMKVLKTFSQSGSSYMFATTFLKWGANYELNNNDQIRFRPLNLELPPFSLTHPLCYGLDGPRDSDHFLGLWRLPLEYMSECKGPQSKGTGRTCSNTTFFQGFF